MKRRLGNLERQLFAYGQLRRLREVRTGDLTKPLGITPKQERELYDRLARGGSSPRSGVGCTVYDWARFNSLPRGYSWIARDLAEGRVQPASIVATTLQYGDLGTIRRIGALLARRGANAALQRELDGALPQSTASIPWIPSKPKRGRSTADGASS
jgi:hypothetical protein